MRTDVRPHHWDLLVERFTDALLTGEETEAHRQVVRLHRRGVPLRELLTQLFAPAGVAIGDAWESHAIGVAEEHRASEILTRLLGELNPRVSGRRRGVVVVATPPEEQHTLPTTFAAVALRDDRWTVEHLGSGVPARSLLEFIERVRPDLAVLSPTVVPVPMSTRTIANAVERLRVPVLVGGPGRTLDELCSLAAGVVAAR